MGANKVGLFYAVFAAGNFLGPLLLGRLFDTVGRRPMIAGTYLVSAAMLVGVAILFNGEQFSDWGLTLALSATFFFASAGASSAYLTVSEIFPMEVRALAIAFFYAVGTAIGGITGPLVFQKLGESGDPGQVAIAYLIGAAVMAVGGITELILGVRAEQQSLEDIAPPITAQDAERGEAGAEDGDDRAAIDERSAADQTARRQRARLERERRGRHRYRLGPSSTSVSPFWPTVAEDRPEWQDREVEIIDRATREGGAQTRAQLAQRVGARYWGPGRFRAALRAAVADGRCDGWDVTPTAPATTGPRPRLSRAREPRLQAGRSPVSVLGRGRDDALALRPRLRPGRLEALRERRRGEPLRERLRS